MMIRIGLMKMEAMMLGRMRYPAELMPIIASASICSVTRMVPISEAMLEPTFPARIRLTMDGENSRMIESLVANPTAYKGIQGLEKPNADWIVITAPIKMEMIAT